MERIDYKIQVEEEFEVCPENIAWLYNLKDAHVLHDVHVIGDQVYIVAQGGFCVAQNGDWIVKERGKWWTIMPKDYHARIKRANRIKQD